MRALYGFITAMRALYGFITSIAAIYGFCTAVGSGLFFTRGPKFLSAGLYTDSPNSQSQYVQALSQTQKNVSKPETGIETGNRLISGDTL